MNHEPTDPPMEPLPGTAIWYESEPDPIANDLDLAVLIVRIGLASNALNTQLQAVIDDHFKARAMNTVLSSLVTSAALTMEATRLARENMSTLRDLVGLWPNARTGLLDDVGKLCAGKHPAGDTLNRARNQLAFHWDDEAIRASVREYGKNKKIVWLEVDSQSLPVHRLATDVLGHALFEGQLSEQELKDGASRVSQAMELMTEFLSACLFGYLKSIDAIRRTRDPNALNNEGAPDEGA